MQRRNFSTEIYQSPETNSGSATLAAVLTQLQYVSPHSACLSVISKAADRTGLCGQPAGRVLRRMEIQPTMAVGRLSRSQLLQLAHTFYRFARRLPAPVTIEPVEAGLCRV